MEHMDFPRILYHPAEPSRIFESQAELDAAGPGWVLTPGEAEAAAAQATRPTPLPDPPLSDEGPTAPRSRR